MNLSFRESVIWLAGYLEGEGCFHLHPTNKKKYPGLLYPKITVTATDEDVIAKVSGVTKTAYGTVKPQKKNWKPLFSCQINGPNARGWMMMIYPFMGERRQAKIKEVLAAWRD